MTVRTFAIVNAALAALLLGGCFGSGSAVLPAAPAAPKFLPCYVPAPKACAPLPALKRPAPLEELEDFWAASLQRDSCTAIEIDTLRRSLADCGPAR